MLAIDLTGKVALVTGASGDLGRVIAPTLAQAGANVAIHYYRNKEQAQKVLQQVQDQGVKGIIVQADVTDAQSINQMQQQVTDQLGDADIIINNAVSQYQWTTILKQNPADYEDQFQTCTMHNVLMAKAFVPAMIKKKWGRVIGLNTECAMQCTPSQSAYASAKRAMDGILRTLAREVGPFGITVNQVAPGWMISDRDRTTNQEKQPEYEALIPLRHRGQDIDIAYAVAFLASDLAAFISGQYLSVSGGNVMPTI